jgi:predicted permease
MSAAERRERRWLGVLLAVIDAGRWLAPRSRRREWRRQWRADIWHEWQWITAQRRGISGRAGIARRAAGAFRHAWLLRMHVRRVEMITQDLRYGWRQMLRRPGFTAVAVLTLGLGIGANVTMFSWLNITLHRQIAGVADGDRWVALNMTSRSRADLSVSYPDFLDYRARRPDSIEDLIVFNLAPMNMRTNAEPVRVFGELVSGNYFDALGVRPSLGRGFLPHEDEAVNRDAVVVLSHNFWRRRFASSPSIVGQTIALNGRAFTVVGVAPEGFSGSEPYLDLDLWVPIKMQPIAMSGVDRLSTRDNHWLQSMVKLRPGVSLSRAQADLELVARDVRETNHQTGYSGVKLSPLYLSPNAGGAAVVGVMGIQQGVAAIVLLIACANVANLLLANATKRQRETAVRLTLGASRTRLLQQLLTESTLLAGLGGVAGIAFAYWAKDLVRWFIPPAPLPIAMNPALDRSVLLFAVFVTMATAVIFGLMPALHGSASSVIAALKESAAAVTATPRRARLRKALVVAQVALSLVLLVSAGLFLRTLANAQSVDPGFSTRSGILASIDLLPAGYDAARGRQFQLNLLARVRELPGVEAASFASRVPLGFGGSSDMAVRIDGYTPAPNEEMQVYYNRVSSDYLKTLGIRLLEGREFTDRDINGAPDVAIVNETLVRRYFAGRNPIGGRIRAGSRTLEIVGIARDGKYSNISETPRPFMYLAQPQWYRPDTVLQVRTSGEPGAIVPALHSAIRAMDGDIPLFDIRTIEDHLEIAVFVQRMVASLLGAFGFLALLLATVGLYGVVAAIVVQRTAEIGMRMALGARSLDIIQLILRQGFGMIALGIAIGLGISLATTRFFKSLLVGVSATDAFSFVGTTVLLLIVALLATYLPARRAATVDPLVALRNE